MVGSKGGKIMNTKLVLSAIGITMLGSVAGVFAQGAQPQQPMSFFVTSKTPAGTGNLGGLAGADQICQSLAASAGAGNRTWRAYLSTEARPNQPAVNARGRIGPGPWYNAKGILIAGSVADLHGDNQRDRNAIRQANVLDEKGQMVPCGGGGVCEHDILTGSDSMGRAFTDGTDHTCMNWTSDAMTVPPTADQAKEGVPASRARAMLGHSDRGLNPGPGNISWNAAHMSQGCTKQALINSGGSGRFYCFAIN
jgi:hypothetical protein